MSPKKAPGGRKKDDTMTTKRVIDRVRIICEEHGVERFTADAIIRAIRIEIMSAELENLDESDESREAMKRALIEIMRAEIETLDATYTAAAEEFSEAHMTMSPWICPERIESWRRADLASKTKDLANEQRAAIKHELNAVTGERCFCLVCLQANSESRAASRRGPAGGSM